MYKNFNVGPQVDPREVMELIHSLCFSVSIDSRCPMVLEQITWIKMKGIAFTSQADYYEISDPLQLHDEENPDFELKYNGIL